MVAASCNIYLSAAQPHAPKDGGESDTGRHHPDRYTWLISVEPHKSHMPFILKHKVEPVHCYASREEGEAAYSLHTHGTDGIIGTILVKEGAHGDAAHIHQALEADLKSASASAPSEEVPDGKDDRWIRKALHILQAHEFTDAFDVGELVTFARGYFANRLDSDAPARIAYPGLHKDHKEKSSKHHFWLSYPTKAANSGDPESRIYGGLM
ncbi:hypothetical protein B0A55_07108 [Friedmanniomyces simplex]|uniref:Uncharacterized protein n=1 Tax=Friedmanniomyces simplex TaxID=329884 RepID=A0A4U0WZZ0_9PEZI|nr:hypothetical protein B0A55_07108 [Friedmanniomyces simplex]